MWSINNIINYSSRLILVEQTACINTAVVVLYKHLENKLKQKIDQHILIYGGGLEINAND